MSETQRGNGQHRSTSQCVNIKAIFRMGWLSSSFILSGNWAFLSDMRQTLSARSDMVLWADRRWTFSPSKVNTAGSQHHFKQQLLHKKFQLCVVTSQASTSGVIKHSFFSVSVHNQDLYRAGISQYLFSSIGLHCSKYRGATDKSSPHWWPVFESTQYLSQLRNQNHPFNHSAFIHHFTCVGSQIYRYFWKTRQVHNHNRKFKSEYFIYITHIST